jgi:hypothetical protein
MTEELMLKRLRVVGVRRPCAVLRKEDRNAGFICFEMAPNNKVKT